MNDLNLYLPGVVLAMLTALAAFAWWFIARRNEKWRALVDRENDFWVQKGMLSPTLAERIKKHEKGPVPKMLAAAATCVGVVGLISVGITLTQVIMIEHQKVKLPYNPALMPQPARLPSPKPAAKPPTKAQATNAPTKHH